MGTVNGVSGFTIHYFYWLDYPQQSKSKDGMKGRERENLVADELDRFSANFWLEPKTIFVLFPIFFSKVLASLVIVLLSTFWWPMHRNSSLGVGFKFKERERGSEVGDDCNYENPSLTRCVTFRIGEAEGELFCSIWRDGQEEEEILWTSNTPCHSHVPCPSGLWSAVTPPLFFHLLLSHSLNNSQFCSRERKQRFWSSRQEMNSQGMNGAIRFVTHKIFGFKPTEKSERHRIKSDMYANQVVLLLLFQRKK